MNDRGSRHRNMLRVAGTTFVFLCAALCRADDDPTIKTPQPAAVLLTNGKVIRGVLVKVTPKEVRIQVVTNAGPAAFKIADVKAVQTADATYVFNADKGAFEIQAAKDPPAKDPPDKAADDKAPDDKQTVIAEGVGADGDEALKDAFRAAIRQVVGTLVDSETLVANDKIISDKVLTYSDGIIKGGYKELSRNEEKGIVRIRISASVERRSVALKLKEANVTVKEVEGKDIAAEILTAKEARENAAELVQKAMAELPALLTVEPGKVNAKDYDEDAGTLHVAVAVGADVGKFAAFQKKLVALLDKVSRAKDTGITDLSKPTFPDVPTQDEKNWVFWISTGMDAQLTRGRWNIYVMDCDLTKCFSGVDGKFSVNVSLLDKDGQVVTEEEKPIMNWSVRKGEIVTVQPGGVNLGGVSSLVFRQSHASIVSTDKGAMRIFKDVLGIAPLCFDSNKRAYQLITVYPIDVKLTVAELARMKEIKCKVVFRPDKTEDK